MRRRRCGRRNPPSGSANAAPLDGEHRFHVSIRAALDRAARPPFHHLTLTQQTGVVLSPADPVRASPSPAPSPAPPGPRRALARRSDTPIATCGAGVRCRAGRHIRPSLGLCASCRAGSAFIPDLLPSSAVSASGGDSPDALPPASPSLQRPRRD
ncbi:hypothetical protein K505DRAFT_396732, partial [Melanomma pulvis-pyrius CBS 109.77]